MSQSPLGKFVNGKQDKDRTGRRRPRRKKGTSNRTFLAPPPHATLRFLGPGCVCGSLCLCWAGTAPTAGESHGDPTESKGPATETTKVERGQGYRHRDAEDSLTCGNAGLLRSTQRPRTSTFLLCSRSVSVVQLRYYGRFRGPGTPHAANYIWRVSFSCPCPSRRRRRCQRRIFCRVACRWQERKCMR